MTGPVGTFLAHPSRDMITKKLWRYGKVTTAPRPGRSSSQFLDTVEPSLRSKYTGDCRKASTFKNSLESSSIPVLLFWSSVHFPER